MKIAFIIFNNMTALDFVGVYDAVTRLKTMGFREDISWEVCAYTETALDNTGLQITPTKVREPLDDYDVVIVPGGFGTRTLIKDEGFMSWLATSAACKLKASVCTGSILLGKAGFLRGKKATTHPTSFDDLKPFCAEVVDHRVVDEGEVITARGVTSAIDLGLYLIQKFTGSETREKIRQQMDYHQ